MEQASGMLGRGIAILNVVIRKGLNEMTKTLQGNERVNHTDVLEKNI